MVEEEGITVVDFKTDYVTEETMNTVVDRYRSQIGIYADALSRIYRTAIKDKFLYLFHLDRFVSV